MALLCIVCKSACGFGGVATDDGPLCESCAVSEANASPETLKPKIEVSSTPRATESNGEPPAAAVAGDRAASPSIDPIDPRSFVPERGAEALTIEVEEWLYRSTGELLSTPTDLHRDQAYSPLLGYSRFVVVLEWQRDNYGPTFRDIGPSFGMSFFADRTESLNQAAAFARIEARRLKCHGPFGYKPARFFEV